MIEQDKKIRKGLPPARDATCYQVLQDIVIPAGTILRHDGDDRFAALVYPRGKFIVTATPADPNNAFFKRVIAA